MENLTKEDLIKILKNTKHSLLTQSVESLKTEQVNIVFEEEAIEATLVVEAPGDDAAIFLTDYTGTDVGQGFVEYSIPLSDFTDLDFSEIRIPFAMWNPTDGGGGFVTATVLIDNIYFSN